MDRMESSTSTVPEARREVGGADVPVLLIAATGAERSQRGRAVRVPRGPGLLRIGRASAAATGQERGGGRDADGGSGPIHLGLRDPLLSREHLRIVPRVGGYEVVDEGSLNGTFLDGRRLVRPAALLDGSILCFGRHAAVFRYVQEDALEALEQDARTPFGPVPTMSPQLALELGMLRRLARSDGEVLLLGETGVGKEVYARALHRLSGRRGRFVAVNCAAIPIELAESELFGHARGAHSTATEARVGLLGAADGGTLFLDEIGEASPRLQPKLLRFLQDREVWPVGGRGGQKVDVKVVAATADLATGAAGGHLRHDLVARLGASPVTIPPLRKRIEDVGALIAHFAGARAAAVEPEVQRAFCAYAWPRNVRELEKVMKRANDLAGGRKMRLEHLPAVIRQALENGPLIEISDRRRRAAPTQTELRALLVQHDGNVAAVARSLDRRWNVVWRWVLKHDLLPGRTDRSASG